jgi:hypothetical protein
LAVEPLGEPIGAERETSCVGQSFDQVFEAEYRPLRGYLYRRLGSSEADEVIGRS